MVHGVGVVCGESKEWVPGGSSPRRHAAPRALGRCPRCAPAAWGQPGGRLARIRRSHGKYGRGKYGNVPGRLRAPRSDEPPLPQRRPETWRSGAHGRRARCPATCASGGGRRTAPPAEGAPAPCARRSSHATCGAIVCGTHGTPEAGTRTAHVLQCPPTASCPVPQVRTVRRRPARVPCTHGTAAALCGFTCSGQRANVANAVGSERPRASATSSAKG